MKGTLKSLSLREGHISRENRLITYQTGEEAFGSKSVESRDD